MDDEGSRAEPGIRLQIPCGRLGTAVPQVIKLREIPRRHAGNPSIASIALVTGAGNELQAFAIGIFYVTTPLFLAAR
ncbi:hypothetical protein BX600DRAFT_508194 [Xylariales sp. PMI_506]|nr:hypothetical protein BX600DRAFT_508194 [Xylariales sp. PMI_506]